jgi:hypothetical protein
VRAEEKKDLLLQKEPVWHTEFSSITLILLEGDDFTKLSSHKSIKKSLTIIGCIINGL